MDNKSKDKKFQECIFYFHKVADKVSSCIYLGSQKTLRSILRSINLNMSKSNISATISIMNLNYK